jgi:hypothetical protein
MLQFDNIFKYLNIKKISGITLYCQQGRVFVIQVL